MPNLRALVLVLLVLGCGGAALLFYLGAFDPGVSPAASGVESVGGQDPEAAARLAGAATGDPVKAGESRQAVMDAPGSADAAAAPRQRVALRGRLVLPGGVPAAGVDLEFHEFLSGEGMTPGRRRERAAVSRVPGRTDAAGRFDLQVPADQKGALALLGKAVVLQRDAARSTVIGGHRREVEVAGEPVDLGDIAVLRAASLRGQVIAGGRGVAGVEIALDWGTAFALMIPALTKTDADGRFELTGMYPARLELSTRSPQFLPAKHAVELTEGERREGVIIQLRAGGFVSGTVVDDRGAPVPGATVSAARASAPLPGLQVTAFLAGESTTTDASGRFHLAGLEQETVQLRATKSGYVDGEAADAKVGQAGIAIEVRRFAQVSGVLVDGAGQGIAGSEVQARSAGRSSGMMFREAGDPVRTDEAGRFTLAQVRPGENTLIATGSGHLPVRQRIEVRPGETHDKVRLVTRPGTSLTIDVVDQRGQPVAGADVTVARHEEGLDQGLLSALPGGQSASRAIKRRVRRSADGGRSVDTGFGGRPEILGRGKTDAHGVAVVAGLPSGAIEVTATHAALAMTGPTGADLPEAGTAHCKVEMQRGGFAQVSVVDAAGKPIAGASIEVAGPMKGKPEDAAKHTHEADAAGAVTIGPLRPGAYRAALQQAARPRSMAGGMSFAMIGDKHTLRDSALSFAVEPGETTTLELIRPILTTVRGVVRDAEGMVAGAEVELLAEGEFRLPLGGNNKTRTDADGRFELGDMSSGSYTLFWTREGSPLPAQKAIVLATNQALHEEELRIPGGRIELRAVDGGEGFGIGGAEVALRRVSQDPPAGQPAGQPAQRRSQAMVVMIGMPGNGGGGGSTIRMNSGGAEAIRTDAKGNAVLLGVPSGEYTLTIEHGDYARVTRKVRLGEDQRLDLGTLPMTVGCRVRGRIQWASPPDQALAMVEIADLEGGNRDSKIAHNGSFKFEGLAAGTYKLRARPVSAAEWGPPQTVVVQPGRGELVTIEIPAGR